MSRKRKLKNEKRDIMWTGSIRTDLAIENREMLGGGREKIEGVRVKTEEKDGISITHVKILDEKGSKIMGKPKGNYVTIESSAMKENDITVHEKIIKEAAKKLSTLLKIKKNSLVLVVGLGNWNITPDALGPKVISKVLVTRHILDSLPKEIDESVRPVAAVSPGVMGITGIETVEIVKGIVERLKPAAVIAIDALAARKFSRINTTIQMSDTGVCPGAGVGNKRMELSEKTLNIPVIAIGVPTVVDAATLVNDTMDRMIEQMIAGAKSGSDFYEMLRVIDKDEKYELITEILDPYVGNMFVTPKEVDAVVERLANIIANSINIGLHTGITMEDINRYTY